MQEQRTSSGHDAVNAADFRASMRKLAASVTIITTANDGIPHGMTATAVSSVSADPPTILVVINKTSRSHPLIDSSRIFAVNLLSSDQKDLADHFSAKHPDQFSDVRYRLGPKTGAPVFDKASFLECRLIDQFDVETHTVFVGRVLHCAISEGAPLLYYAGAYRGLEKAS